MSAELPSGEIVNYKFRVQFMCLLQFLMAFMMVAICLEKQIPPARHKKFMTLPTHECLKWQGRTEKSN